MTEKQRLKHEADNANRTAAVPHLPMADFREPKTPPRLSWVNAKTYKGFADRKHLPGRKEEQIDAIYDYAAATEEKRLNDAGKDLPDHQREVPNMAAGTPQA